MSPQQRRGQQIYLTGKSPSDQEINARLISAGVQLPASLVPCVNCHNYDGRGIPEGGIKPADIRWHQLTKPYGVTHSSGHHHQPYDKRSLIKAIGLGIDPAGQALNPVMPRYQLTHQDMNDLVAFLRGLGTYSVTGIDDANINIGVILPSANPTKAMAVRQILDAYFTDLNEQGGIYQRQIQLVFIDPPATHNQMELDEFKRRLDKSNVFAFVASHLGGIEAIMADFTQSSGAPVIGAFSPTPLLAFPLNRYIFYLLSGHKRQTLALLIFANKINFPAPSETQSRSSAATRAKSAILIELKSDLDALPPYLIEQQERHPELEIIEVDAIIAAGHLKSLLTELRQKQLDVIYLLVSPPTQAQFFKLAAAIDWWPYVLIPGSQMSGDLFNSPLQFDQRIFLAMPNLPLDYKQAGLTRYRRLQESHQVTSQYRNSQLLAIASASLLTEGLTKIGREMEQQKLVAMVEGLYRYDTELTQAISYGPNRRLGASGAYIVTIDLINKTIRPTSDWLEIN